MTLSILHSVARFLDRQKDQQHKQAPGFRHLPEFSCHRFIFTCGHKIRPAIQEHWAGKLSVVVDREDRRFVFSQGKAIVAEALFLNNRWELRVLPNHSGK